MRVAMIPILLTSLLLVACDPKSEPAPTEPRPIEPKAQAVPQYSAEAQAACIDPARCLRGRAAAELSL